MNNKQQNNSTEEEIEISSLFDQIARFFFYITSSITSLANKLWYVFIYLLVHFKKHFLIIGGISMLFGVVASFIILSKERDYTSSMTVKPHYNSTELLYNNIQYYNQLIEQKDTLLLATILNCSPSITSKLSEISINPFVTNLDRINVINNYYNQIDTNLLKSDKFKIDFEKDIDSYDYDLHTISVSAKGDFDFIIMEDILLNGVSKNPYFVKQQGKNKSNQLEKKKALKRSIDKLDTLSSIFNSVLVENSKKVTINSPNPLFEKERKSDIKDIKWVFDDFTSLNIQLSDVNVKLSYIDLPITIINGFNSRGIKEPRFYKIILATLAGFLFAVIFLFTRNLINYLTKVEEDYL